MLLYHGWSWGRLSLTADPDREKIYENLSWPNTASIDGSLQNALSVCGNSTHLISRKYFFMWLFFCENIPPHEERMNECCTRLNVVASRTGISGGWFHFVSNAGNCQVSASSLSEQVLVGVNGSDKTPPSLNSSMSFSFIQHLPSVYLCLTLQVILCSWLSVEYDGYSLNSGVLRCNIICRGRY